LIVVFWLAATGWLFWHDLWPQWRPGEPPPFHIDLVEEVQKEPNNKDWNKIDWNVQLDGKDVFKAATWVTYDKENETFDLHAHYRASTMGSNTRKYEVARIFQVTKMASVYRVTRAGELRSLSTEIVVSLPKEGEGQSLFAWANLFQKKVPAPPKGNILSPHDPTREVHFNLWGEVQDGQFFAHCQAVSPRLERELKIDLPPAAVSHNGSVLLPLHPVNRIHGLRPGQTWRQPLVDPFRDALAALPGLSGGPHFVTAHVLDQPQTLTLGDKAETACLVIEYEDEGEIVGRTWVEQDSERVQRQEAQIGGDHWSMTRDNARTPSRRLFGQAQSRRPQNDL
jgi:hypothetical protein